ncbi:MAG: TadE/TadG family type IV pilus assembly protein [Oricola sp.]
MTGCFEKYSIPQALAGAMARFRGDRRGVAATEFILFLPIMLVLGFGLAEVYVEHATEDQFLRFVHQSGDLLAREPTLTSAEITTIRNTSTQMIKGFDANRTLAIQVSSIGFKADGTPVVLWNRTAGGTFATPDPTDVTEMGFPADTVIRLEAKLNYTSPFNYVWESTARQLTSVAFFRPRETRAISMDGAISETDPNWDYIPPE